MSKVIVIGGGASGMIAAVFAARNGNEVILFEKNEKLGKKLFITGKGRCNITNACDRESFFENIMTNERFFYSAFSGFNNWDTIDFFNEIGLETKIERGNRVFPVSDHSSDVNRVLEQELKKQKVQIHLHTKVEKLLCKDNRFAGVILENKQEVQADACIVATGGLSYATTGSTGDGYQFAKEIGHNITELFPSLVSIRLKEDYVSELEGLSLKNVEVTITGSGGLQGKNKEQTENHEWFRGFGEMLFTRNGVSGPLILSASSKIASNHCEGWCLHINLKPALTKEQLDSRILRDFEKNKNKQFRNALGELLLSRLSDRIVVLSGIDPYKQVNQITQEERTAFGELLQDMRFTIQKPGGYNEAVITRGGISVKEITPSTMESRLVQGLYFTGEVLDLDAMTGGYNLQIAWSTGHAAGSSIY